MADFRECALPRLSAVVAADAATSAGDGSIDSLFSLLRMVLVVVRGVRRALDSIRRLFFSIVSEFSVALEDNEAQTMATSRAIVNDVTLNFICSLSNYNLFIKFINSCVNGRVIVRQYTEAFFHTFRLLAGFTVICHSIKC